MQIKERDYASKPVLTKDSAFYSKYSSMDSVCYPEYLQFFTNLRYLVSMRYKSFAEFSRLLFAAYAINVKDSTVSGYEKGFFKTAQYNWLKAISVFLNENVHEMLTISFQERDLKRAEPV